MDNNFAHQDLRISLDGDSHDGSEQTSPYYAPGQAVSGTAVYTPQAEVKVESMTVVFKATLYAELKDNGQTSYGCVRTLNQNLFPVIPMNQRKSQAEDYYGRSYSPEAGQEECVGPPE